MHVTDEFKLHWKKYFSSLLPPHTKVLLAVSGGMDSVVMADLFYSAKIPAAIAHVNFHLRGDESNRDEQFVEALAAYYHFDYQMQEFDTDQFAKENKLSVQEAARVLRYHWFHDLLVQKNKENNYALIATAHHANDSIETMLINFFRGTGISGMHGILPVHEKIIRPLIFWKQEKLKTYAIEKNLTWVDDSSNESDKYTRNYLRHQLIPSVQKVFPEVNENLLANISRFSEIEKIYHEAIEDKKKKLVKQIGEEWHFHIAALKKTNAVSTLLWEILKDFNFTTAQVPEVIKLFDSNYGASISSATHRLIKHREKLIIAPLKVNNLQHYFIQKETEKLHTPAGDFLFKIKDARNFTIPKSAQEAALDYSKITFPLVLRHWKAGDYFYPLGMKKKKKEARFLVDMKYSLPEKEKCMVLENAEKHILWIVGLRIDDRFKMTTSTKEVLHISVK